MVSRWRAIVVLGSLVLLALAPAARAVAIYTSDGTWGADAFVQGSPSGDNYGASNGLVLKNGSPADTYARKAYLRFDLQSPGAGIIEATLSLVVQTNNGGGTDPNPKAFSVQVFGLLDSYAGVDNNTDGDVIDDGDIHDEFWPEAMIDWTSAPGNVTTSGYSFNSYAALLGTLNVAASDIAGSLVTMASNQALVDFLNADTNGVVTFLLRRTGANAGGSNNLAFYSKEFTPGVTLDEPTLTILTPEPCTLTLAAIGGLTLLARRRRRSAH